MIRQTFEKLQGESNTEKCILCKFGHVFRPERNNMQLNQITDHIKMYESKVKIFSAVWNPYILRLQLAHFYSSGPHGLTK